MSKIKQITKEEVNVLLKNGVLKNTTDGLVNQKGYPTGFYTTRTKKYIEDKYVDIARKLMK